MIPILLLKHIHGHVEGQKWKKTIKILAILKSKWPNFSYNKLHEKKERRENVTD